MRFPSTVQPTDFQSALHLVRSCGIGITLVVRQLCRIALDRNAREQFEAAGIFVAHCEMEAVYLRGNTPDDVAHGYRFQRMGREEYFHLSR